MERAELTRYDDEYVDVYTPDFQRVGTFNILLSTSSFPVNFDQGRIECKADVKDVTLEILSIINHDSSDLGMKGWIFKKMGKSYFFTDIRYLDYDGQYITFMAHYRETLNYVPTYEAIDISNTVS